MFQPRLPVLSCLLICSLLTISTAGCVGFYAPKGAPFQSLSPGMQDPALEAAILEAAKKRAAMEKWSDNFIKVKIISSEWTADRDPATGIIDGRLIEAWVYATHSDGRCSYHPYRFRQAENGGSYSKIVELVGGAGIENTCPCVE